MSTSGWLQVTASGERSNRRQQPTMTSSGQSPEVTHGNDRHQGEFSLASFTDFVSERAGRAAKPGVLDRWVGDDSATEAAGRSPTFDAACTRRRAC